MIYEPGEAADILFAEGVMCDDLCISVPADPSPQFIDAERYLGWARLAESMSSEDGPYIVIHECLRPSAQQIRAIHERQAGRGQI